MDIRRLNWNGMMGTYKVDNMIFGGQISPETIDEMKQAELNVVINMRNHGENDSEVERAYIEKAGITYHHLPILGPTGFQEDSILKVREILKENDYKAMIHCASGNRIGGWYIIEQVQVFEVPMDQAIENSFQCGLSNPMLVQLAQAYLAK